MAASAAKTLSLRAVHNHSSVTMPIADFLALSNQASAFYSSKDVVIIRGEKLVRSFDDVKDGDLLSIYSRDEWEMHQIIEGMSDLTLGTRKFKLDDFEQLSVVGIGSYGKVVLAKYRPLNNKVCVLKILSKGGVMQKKQLEHTQSEKRILSSLKHPFIVNMFGCFQDEENIYLVLEYVPGGELFKYLDDFQFFDFEVAQFYVAEIVLALQYIHSLDVVYRDLKPENILLDRQGHVKMTDFGFAKKLDDRTYTMCGTLDYLAPEIIARSGHGFAVDFWALGVLVYELLVGAAPFEADTPMQTMTRIRSADVQFPEDMDPVAIDLITNLLQIDTTRRLGCMIGGFRELREHAFFRGVNWSDLLQRKVQVPIVPQVKNDEDSSCFIVYTAADINVFAPLAAADRDPALWADFNS